MKGKIEGGRRTRETRSDRDSESSRILKGAGLRFSLIDRERQLLVARRIIGEDLINKDNRSRRDDLAQLQVVFDLVDFHVLEKKRKVLIGKNVFGTDVPDKRLNVGARIEGDASGRRNETELFRELTSSDFNLEPAIEKHT